VAVHKYLFIYEMYGGIIFYAIMLWFLHANFYQVIFNLFLSTFLILVFSLVAVNIGQKPGKEKLL
jgi:hypothetical protein